jgi:Domain of unknown function (DUF4157)
MSSRIHAEAKSLSIPVAGFQAERSHLLHPHEVEQVESQATSFDNENKLNTSAQPNSLPPPSINHHFGQVSVQARRLPVIQTKLAIGQPGDKYEQEADRVADQIMRMPEPGSIAWRITNPGKTPSIQRVCSECQDEVQRQPVEGEEVLRANSLTIQTTSLAQRQVDLTEEEEEEQMVQTKQRLGQIPSVTPILEARLNANKGSGEPLPEETRSFMESRFGHDFRQVRVHTDAEAVQMNRELNAEAFTNSQDVYFGTGKYNPDSNKGKRLLAHELTHVVQQTQNQAEPMLMRSPLFTSTLSICHQYLRSRRFRVTEGGLRVTINAQWGGEEPDSPLPRDCRQDRPFSVELRDVGWFVDSPWGTCDFPSGAPASRIWTNLPDNEYYLGINTPDTGPYCCLRGSIDVAQEHSLTGQTCTQPPPGPLEILHTALDLAGLIPALGAVPDAINASIYIIEGDWVNAGISAVSMIPIFGDAASVVRVGSRETVRVTGEAVERVGQNRITASLREARASRRSASEAAEDLHGGTRRHPEGGSTSGTRARIPDLPRCRTGSLFCPIDFLQEEFADLFETRRASEFSPYVRELSNIDLNMGRSLRREQTILTGNAMYAQYLREVSSNQWSTPFREALAEGRRYREIVVEGRRYRWPLDDLDNPWVVHHDPPLGWVRAESNQLWHPMPYRIHEAAHQWWHDLQRRVRSRVPREMRQEIFEGEFDIRDL